MGGGRADLPLGCVERGGLAIPMSAAGEAAATRLTLALAVLGDFKCTLSNRRS